MKKFFGLVCLLLLGAVSSFAVPPALACTAPPGGLPTYTVTEHVNESTVVIEGTIASVSDVDYRQVATIEVAQYLKGSGSSVITVDGYGPSGICLSPVQAGDHYLFYITTDSNGTYHALYLSQFDAVVEPSPENIAEAIKASGQPPLVMTPDALVLTEVALASAATAATPTPTPFSPSASSLEQSLTEAWATTLAIQSNYATDPAGQSIIATEAMATIEAAYTQLSLAPTPAPYLPPANPPPYLLTPTPVAPTALEAVGLVGVGVAIGLIVGILGGVIIGLIIGRWRE